jgi:hypothetical protein
MTLVQADKLVFQSASDLRSVSQPSRRADTGTGESCAPDPFPPPISDTEQDDGLLRGSFFFVFQRRLAKATALQRLPNRPKSVSERPASLSERPLP